MNGRFPVFDELGRSLTSSTFSRSFEGDAKRFEGASGEPFAVVDQAKQDVLRADEVVVEKSRLFLRIRKDASGAVGKSLKH